jgi:hypothetical protein
VTLHCPLCERAVESSDLKRVPGTGGGLQCPNCRETVRYKQPYPVLRFTGSVLISVIIVWIAGARGAFVFLVAAFLVWIPVSLFANAYLVHFLPLKLVPWKPRHHTKTPVEIVNERNAAIELFNQEPESKRPPE